MDGVQRLARCRWARGGSMLGTKVYLGPHPDNVAIQVRALIAAAGMTVTNAITPSKPKRDDAERIAKAKAKRERRAARNLKGVSK